MQPSLRFCSLGSGSAGNATLLEASDGRHVTRLLIDCGIPFKQFGERLKKRGLGVQDIDALFVTHEHSDHVGCARLLAQQEGISTWMSRGTFWAMGTPDVSEHIHFARDGQAIVVGNLTLHPFTVAHDAKEPLQLTVSANGKRFGILTDLGHTTPYVLSHLQNLDAVVLEFNHDEAMLQASKYPPFLKQRIAGSYGHLSNAQAADTLQGIHHTGLRHVVAAHLSEQNNHPSLVQEAIARTQIAPSFALVIANAESGFDWINL